MAADLPGAAEVAADARRVAAIALAEDGPSDVTSDVAVLATQRVSATIEAREPLVVAGRGYADAIMAACGLSPVQWNVADGEAVVAGTELGTMTGPFAAVLRAERPLLNLLQRSCG
ncbi:MAG: nicotinate-nucleotide diphosphorylase (carboxylating), partial [Gemmatimonadota bacterium]